MNLISLVLFVFIANKNRITNPKSLLKDSGEYAELSYHLAFNNTFSYDGKTPTNFREPLNSFLNVVNIKLFTNIDESMALEKVKSQPDLVTQLTQINIFFLILLFLGIWWLVFLLTNSHAWVVPTSFMPLVYFSIDTTYLKSLNSDLPSIVILVLAISLLLSFYRKPSILNSIFLAFTLALLIYSKGVFYYLVPVYIVLIVIVILYKDYQSDKYYKIKLLLLSLILSYMLIIPWQIRNYFLLSDFSLTKRGGVVLLIRAEMNEMNEEEHNGMFYFFAPEILKNLFFERFLGYKKEDCLDGGKLQRLNRDLINDYKAIEEKDYQKCISFLRRTMYVSVPNYQNEAEKLNIDSDSYIKKIALNSIKDEWYSHLKMSIPFAWKGLWFYKGNSLAFVLLIGFSYLTFIIIFMWSIIFWKIEYLIFLTFPMIVFVFHVFFTHNIPRYILPIVPFVSLTMILYVKNIFSYLKITKLKF